MPRTLLPGIIIVAALASSAVAAQVPDLATERINLKDRWLLTSSSLVKEDGRAISTSTFRPDQWYPTSVPSTVLNALIKNGVYPDLRIGLNCYLIPDASDEFNRKHNLSRYSYLPDKRNPWKDPYWYRTEFALPDLAKDRRVWLHFNCINYRADVYLNGQQIASRTDMAGMFRRFAFDVTGAARGGINALAVRIHGVDTPGTPDQQLKVFGPERSFFKEIMKDVTEVMTIGYDCMPTVPDRNMGICQDVYVEITGPVVIRDPFITTDLPLPKTDRATLNVTATLANATDSPQTGILKATILQTGQTFQTPVTLAPRQSKEVFFSPAPIIENPRLWWPVSYGPQNLYRLALTFECPSGVSDSQTITFGVRKLTTELYQLDGWHGRRVFINGQRIFCRGGYVQPEILFDWDRRRMENEIRYYAEANLNLIFFEDIPNPPDEFLEACDKLGVLFGNCFYACMWLKPGSGFPADLDLLEKCTVDLVKRYRNHPSLVMYMAMNEGDTREDVYEMWRKHILALDGTRFHIPSAYFPDDRKDAPGWFRKDLPTGMTDLGPKSYGWQEPSTYYQWVRESRNWMFQLENGSASLPPISSLRKFLPDMDKMSSDAPFPLNEDWAHHGANHYYRPYDTALRRLHGQPKTVADYCWKGHLTTADQHRAMFEAVHHRMWDITSGFTQWKINDCWPGVQWQIFDWYLKPMVSYYYIKKACRPLHIQLSLLEPTVTIINNQLPAQSHLTARARVYDLDMKLLYEKEAKADVAPNSYRDVFTMPQLPELTEVYFVALDLRDGKDEVVADNFYWLPRNKSDDLKALASLPMVGLETSHSVEQQGENTLLRVSVRNPSTRLAFFVQLAATKGRGGEEVLPVLWSDNYFSLLPGESKQLTAALATSDLGGTVSAVQVGGWNILTDFQCTALEVPKMAATAGDPITVTATIANTFIDGSRVSLFVDEKPIDSAFVAPTALNAAAKIDFTVRLPAGSHQLRVGSKAASILVN